MKNPLYKNAKLIAITLFISLALKFNGFAQMPSQYSGAVNQMLNQQFMNHMNGIMMSNLLLNKINYFSNPVYKFEVRLLNDSIENIRSKIHIDTILRRYYLLKENKKEPRDSPTRFEKIFVNQTKTISRYDGLYEETIVGLAADSCWQFPIINGKINAFSFLPEISNISTFNISAIQVGNGNIQPLDPKELEKIIADVPKAKKAFDKKDYYKAIMIYNLKQ